VSIEACGIAPACPDAPLRGGRYLGRAGLTVAIGTVMVLLFCWYLLTLHVRS